MLSANPFLAEAIRRKIIKIEGNRVTYTLNREHSYDWADPEEWVQGRYRCMAHH